MAQGAIQSRLLSNLHQGAEKGELDLHTKLSIQAKQNALPKVEFGQVTQPLANDLERLRQKYIVLTPKVKPKSDLITLKPGFKLGDTTHNNNKQPTVNNKQTSPSNNSNNNKEKQPVKCADGIPEARRSFYPAERVRNSWSNNAKSLGGLFNMGNTCYLNASLQCLMHTPTLVNIIMLPDNHPARQGFCPLSALSRLIRQCQTIGPRSAVRPNEIVSHLRKIASHFQLGRQECAHEFTRFFSDALVRSCTAGKGKVDMYEEATTIPHRVFGGWLRSRVQCANCHNNSDSFDSFLDLNLEIKGCDSLQDCLRHYTAREMLDQGAALYKCEKCRRQTRASKRLTIHRPPNVLAISLKRFNIMGNKIGREIKFPSQLNLAPFVSTKNAEHKYDLYAILVHSGFTVNSGHYYSYCRTPRGNWCRFDDSCVTNTGLNNVMMQQPYMLYYIRSSPTIVPRPLVAKVPSSPIQKTKTFDSGHRKPEVKDARPEIKFKNSFVAKEKLVKTNRFEPIASPVKEMKNRFIGPERPKSSNEFNKVKQKTQNGFLNAEQKDKQKQNSGSFDQKTFKRSVSMSSCVSFIKQTTHKESEQQHKQKQQTQQQKPEVKEKVSESPKKLHPALSKIAAYSSDEDNDDDLVKLAREKRERQKENRKRKFNFSAGSYWGIGKAPKWDGRENNMDVRDRAASEAAAASVVSKEQLEIDKGKNKKVKDKSLNRSRSWTSFSGPRNAFQREQMKNRK